MTEQPAKLLAALSGEEMASAEVFLATASDAPLEAWAASWEASFYKLVDAELLGPMVRLGRLLAKMNLSKPDAAASEVKRDLALMRGF